nr:MipA/OmpV family protein [Mesorhizobium sp. NBSH29]
MALAPQASAEGLFGWVHGDWYLTLGGAGFVAPRFDGDNTYRMNFSPLVSLGKVGPEARFSSRNDNISIALLDTGAFRAGIAGKIIFERDSEDEDDLRGLDPIRFGGEAGAFAEIYPTDWLRLRGEVRHGIRSHEGIVGDVSLDAFADLTPAIRVSAGPRVSFASADYFDAYYGVSAQESVASGLTEYKPGSGLKSAGIGAAITWKTTDRITTSAFGEYQRLLGPAADSSLVNERGSKNQFLFGLSATYRFNFQL